MPAYFSVSFELNKNKNAIQEFYASLMRFGFSLNSRHCDENDSIDKIIEWNRNKLNCDYEYGLKDPYWVDYKQILFEFQGFSEIWAYITNRRKKPTFRISLIIPEDDFVEFEEIDGKFIVNEHKEKMDVIKDLAKSVWNDMEILAIQTSWECTLDYPPDAKEILKGEKPLCEPICIIKNTSAVKKVGLPFEEIGKGGVLLEDFDNWNYM